MRKAMAVHKLLVKAIDPIIWDNLTMVELKA